MFMEAPLPGASVVLALGVGVLEPAVVVSAAVVPAAEDEAVALLNIPLLTGAVTLAAPDETGTTTVVATEPPDETGTTTTVVGTAEMPPEIVRMCIRRN
jgi:hypothetical protein